MEISVTSVIYWAHLLSPIFGFVAYYIVVENVPKQNHFIFAYLVICAFADGLNYFKVIPAAIVFNVHDIFQFLIIIAIYVMLLKNRAVIFLGIIILLYVVALVMTLTIIGIKSHHNYMWALSGLLLSIVCLVYLNIVNVIPKEFATNTHIYNALVMNAALLFYFLATFLFFLLSDWVFKTLDSETIRFSWTYHNAIGIIKNIGLAVAIFLTGKAKLIEDTQGKVA